MKNIQRFEEALKLVMESDLKRTEICNQCGISYPDFTYFLKSRYPELIRRHQSKKASEHNRQLALAAEKKYRKAVKLYSSTSMTYKEIAERTGVGVVALASYLRKHHRNLLLRRNGVTASKRRAAGINLRKDGLGQSVVTHEKYREAIEACDDLANIEKTVSDIAREYGIGPSCLLYQLRTHYPEIMPRREAERRMRGIGGNRQIGVRENTLRQYAQAVELLKDPVITIEEAAENGNVSYPGMRMHLGYHKNLTDERREKRITAREEKARQRREEKANQPSIREIRSNERYAEAVEKLRKGDGTPESLSKELGVSAVAFRDYLKRHFPDIASKYGRITTDNGKNSLARSAEKYSAAFEEYKEGKGTMKEIAAKHGLVYNSFSSYVRRNK